MPYLMHIAVSNSNRLRRRVYYFEYGGVHFKLIQNNPHKWADVLLTILPDATWSSEQGPYTAAAEFLSALSWQNRAAIDFHPAGGMGIQDNASLTSARCRVFTFPTIPFYGNMRGY